MAKLCERPGCSEPGAAACGMVPEDLLFWISPLGDAPTPDPNVLCRRHADAMVVPRGWTLDDRREEIPRLFRPRPVAPSTTTTKRPRSRPTSKGPSPEQLQIDGTGEIPRPTVADAARRDVASHTAARNGVGHGGAAGSDTGADGAPGSPDRAAPWQPAFDPDDDLDGLLEASSPLLARAFRGTGRPKT